MFYIKGKMSNIKNFKLVFLGDTAVGKSCITVRYVRDEFFEFQEPTIGAAFLTATVEANNKTARLEIWDTAGQERYRSLAPMYYRGASFALIVYDITKKHTYEGAKRQVDEIQRRGDARCIIGLVGNKYDLKDFREVEEETAIEYANSKDIVFMEVSAKTGHNINNLIITLVDNQPEQSYSDKSLNPNIFGEDCYSVRIKNNNTDNSNNCC